MHNESPDYVLTPNPNIIEKLRLEYKKRGKKFPKKTPVKKNIIE